MPQMAPISWLILFFLFFLTFFIFNILNFYCFFINESLLKNKKFLQKKKFNLNWMW